MISNMFKGSSKQNETTRAPLNLKKDHKDYAEHEQKQVLDNAETPESSLRYESDKHFAERDFGKVCKARQGGGGRRQGPVIRADGEAAGGGARRTEEDRGGTRPRRQGGVFCEAGSLGVWRHYMF